MPVFIIGHVTKSGDIAGPRVLEHIVDVVLYLEGDADRAVRVLRGHKNRYGSTDEVGVFEMVDNGMKPVPSPSALFMGERILTPDVSSAPTIIVQGSRPFMPEVQALCAERTSPEEEQNSKGPAMIPALRTAVGFRPERLQLLLAVLAKFVLGRRLHRNDVFVNIVGGLKLEDPSTDVAVALAIASSFVERALPADMAFFGEVGLGGELRPVAGPGQGGGGVRGGGAAGARLRAAKVWAARLLRRAGGGGGRGGVYRRGGGGQHGHGGDGLQGAPVQGAQGHELEAEERKMAEDSKRRQVLPSLLPRRKQQGKGRRRKALIIFRVSLFSSKFISGFVCFRYIIDKISLYRIKRPASCQNHKPLSI